MRTVRELDGDVARGEAGDRRRAPGRRSAAPGRVSARSPASAPLEVAGGARARSPQSPLSPPPRCGRSRIGTTACDGHLVTGVARAGTALRPPQTVGDEVEVGHLDRRVDLGQLGVVVRPETSSVAVAPLSRVALHVVALRLARVDHVVGALLEHELDRRRSRRARSGRRRPPRGASPGSCRPRGQSPARPCPTACLVLSAGGARRPRRRRRRARLPAGPGRARGAAADRHSAAAPSSSTTVVQGIALSRYQIDGGDLTAAEDTLTATLGQAQELVAARWAPAARAGQPPPRPRRGRRRPRSGGILGLSFPQDVPKALLGFRASCAKPAAHDPP